MNNIKKLLVIQLLIFSVQFVTAQSVSGVVTDATTGETLPGVTVAEPGTSNATMTDADGAYKIDVASNGKLDFSFVGYSPQTIDVNGRNVINAILNADVTELQGVVAIGYGTMKKSDLTGAIGSVSGDKLQKTPASGLDQALSGRVAGVSVNAGSGQPGATAEVRVRGIGTTNHSEPIYVIDGVITDNISFLNPNDIARTDVLKDASATAIYGSQGANGVILITTKQGGSGEGKISFNSYIGFQNRWRKLDLMKRDEMARMEARMSSNAGEKITFFTQGFDQWLRQYKIGSPYYPAFGTYDYANTETDWQDEVFHANAPIHNYYLSFVGGTEKSNYAVSAGYFTQEGTIIGSDYQRLTLRVNTANQIRKWLKVGENLSFVTSTGRNAMNNSSAAGASMLASALTMAPWDPVRYPQGVINNLYEDISGRYAAPANNTQGVNPYVLVDNFKPKDIYERWVGNIYLEISPVKQIVFRTSYSLDLQNARGSSYTNEFDLGPSSEMQRDKNSLSRSMTRWSTFALENILTYSNIWNKKHNLTVMVGQTTEEYNMYGINGFGASILNPIESNWYLNQTTEDRQFASDNVSRTRRFSLLGRIFYSFSDRYLITVNFRADGSSKFPRHTWGYFPSTSLAWRVNEEDFMKNIKWIDNLKLRFGWGRVGNDRSADATSFITTMFTTGPSFTGYVWGPNGGLTGYYQTVDKNGAAVLTLANQDGKWETTETWNAGLDFSFKKGLISGTIDIFRRDTKDMILQIETPAPVGNRYLPSANVGVVRNTGIELMLSHQYSKRDFSYTVEGNVSLIKNKLIALNGGSPIWGDKVKSDLGLPLYTFWGYEYLGVYQTEEEAQEYLFGYSDIERPYHAGDAKFKDQNNDGKIDGLDETALGSNFPWLAGGLNFSATYKNIDLNLFFQGVYGNEIYNAQRIQLEGTGKGTQISTAMRDVYLNFSDDHKNALVDAGLNLDDILNFNGTIPNPNGTFNAQNSSRFIESGAYLRLKNIELGYTLPLEITKKVQIQRLRLYVSASNLLTLTGYSGYDPEVGGGVDYGNYPQSRTWMFGVNLDF